MEGLPEWLQAHPRYGYLIVAGILLLWLVGIVCGWRWTYSRPGSWEGNFWLGTLGERSWKSHATLTLLAKQDLAPFGYNMIDPLKSWCWGSILFYPFKISRFS